jgi:hypothetical protein
VVANSAERAGVGRHEILALDLVGLFTSTEVVYGVTGTDVTGLPESGVAVKRGGQLAILRDAKSETKECESGRG